MPCDLTSLAAVRKAAQDITIKLIQLDILTCNAGTMATPPSLSTDGYETQFATNHLGHAQLDQSLLPFLERTAASQGDARIVCLSSLGYQLVNSNDFATLNTTQNNRFFASWIRYGQSKLANMLYAHQLAAKHPELSVISVHPGVIAINLVGTLGYVDRAIVYATDIGRMVTAEQGAMNSVWAASVEKKDLTNGGLRASWQGG